MFNDFNNLSKYTTDPLSLSMRPTAGSEAFPLTSRANAITPDASGVGGMGMGDMMQIISLINALVPKEEKQQSPGFQMLQQRKAPSIQGQDYSNLILQRILGGM